MAQAQVLHRRRSYHELDLLRQSFSQPQVSLDYNLQASGASSQFSNFGYGHSMAQPLMQRRCAPESQMQSWPFPQTMPRAYKPTVAAPLNAASSSGMASQEQYWRAGPTIDNTFAWNSILPMEPLIMADPDYHYIRNNGLTYNPMAAENIVDGVGVGQGSEVSWVPSGPCGLPHGTSLTGSDLDTNSSLSPKSYLSENLESKSFSPGSMVDQVSPGGDWNGYSMSFPPVKEASPIFPSSKLHLGSMPSRTNGVSDDVGCSGLPRGLGSTMPSLPPAGASHQENKLAASLDDARHTGSEYSCSQESSSGALVWYHPDYSHDLSGLPYSSQDSRAENARLHGPTNALSESNSSRAEHGPAPWSDSRADFAAQNRVQDRLQLPRSADVQAQRKRNDDLLIQGKKEGLTYKEIRRKMVGEKPAESTLRGRYRSLTKAKHDRVRKPIWTKRDIDLLNQFVDQEFQRIDNTAPYTQAVSLDQKLIKVAWKKVADFIHEQGGSYHFGNSTCKRKWLELKKGS